MGLWQPLANEQTTHLGSPGIMSSLKTCSSLDCHISIGSIKSETLPHEKNHFSPGRRDEASSSKPPSLSPSPYSHPFTIICLRTIGTNLIVSFIHHRKPKLPHHPHLLCFNPSWLCISPIQIPPPTPSQLLRGALCNP